MQAVTWHGRRDVRLEEVPDPAIQEPTDAIACGGCFMRGQGLHAQCETT